MPRVPRPCSGTGRTLCYSALLPVYPVAFLQRKVTSRLVNSQVQGVEEVTDVEEEDVVQYVKIQERAAN